MILKVCVDFSEVASCVHDAKIVPPLLHDLIIMGWLFFRMFNIVFSFNVRLL